MLSEGQGRCCQQKRQDGVCVALSHALWQETLSLGVMRRVSLLSSVPCRS